VTPTWEQFAEHVERIAISSGWLYRTSAWVELSTGINEPRDGYWHWSDPVFVPDRLGQV